MPFSPDNQQNSSTFPDLFNSLTFPDSTWLSRPVGTVLVAAASTALRPLCSHGNRWTDRQTDRWTSPLHKTCYGVA